MLYTLRIRGGGYSCNDVKKEVYQTEVITSGSIIDLNIYKQIGAFREDYFIYVVDYEYCWRARYCGFKIQQFNDIFMHHQIDDFITIISDETGKTERVYIREVSDSAFYYAFRNTCYLLNEYKAKLSNDVKKRKIAFIRGWLSTAKRSGKFCHKMKFALKGIADYKNNVTGKMREKN